MDFKLNEEQLELQELTHQFAANEIKPVAAEYDEKNEFPLEVMKKAAEIGFLSSGDSPGVWWYGFLHHG